MNHYSIVHFFRMCLHVPSRSEGIETSVIRLYLANLITGLHVPSRSEGIETLFRRCESRSVFLVYTCLPVRRELKRDSCNTYQHSINKPVYTCLPVRRELKHTLPPMLPSESAIRVYTCLPVRRELKLRLLGLSPRSSPSLFTRAFPFGGN